jgi:urease accessory protein
MITITITITIIITVPTTTTRATSRTTTRMVPTCTASLPTRPPFIGTATATTTAVTADGESWREAPLLLWLSPAFPVGAFAYSHGLEWAFEAGDITGAASLAAWLADLARFGGPQLDASLFALAFRAAAAADWPALDEVNATAVALAGSAERRLETTAQGAAFRLAARAAWDSEPLRRVASRDGEPLAYPVAVAAAAAGCSMASSRATEAFVVGQFANLVSAATRLGIVGQTDGLKILAGIFPALAALAREAAGATLDELGGCALRSDIAAMRHETQYSRLFRS